MSAYPQTARADPLSRRIRRSRSAVGLRAAAVAMAGGFALLGCKADGPIVPENLNPQPIDSVTREDIPDYADLVQRYNQTAASLPRVWARTDVELRWRNEKGKARRESGDGRLIF